MKLDEYEQWDLNQMKRLYSKVGKKYTVENDGVPGDKFTERMMEFNKRINIKDMI